MKKFIPGIFILALSFNLVKAQADYSIKFNLKNCVDSSLYIIKYLYDKQYLEDTNRKVKNGFVEFKGKKNLDKGMYALVSSSMVKYFDFMVNESQKFTITADMNDLAHTLKSADSKENQTLFSYANFMSAKEIEYRKAMREAAGKSKPDSIAYVKAKQKTINEEVKQFDVSFFAKNKGSFVCDFLNLRVEKYAPNVPKASNGRPDSVYQYYYYKSHFFDGINFKDDRIARLPFFADRLHRYMDVVIVQHPDTVIAEIDKLLARCNEGNVPYNLIIGDLTYKYEQNKTMSFDRNGKTTTFEKVFVHMGENYIVNGKAKDVYSDETAAKIKERVEILRNLLPEATVSELFMIDTASAPQVRKMGFDTVQSSKTLTDLYYKNAQKLTPLFKTLYEIKAKYTVLVFWAVDCDHCQTEIPLLNENMKKLKDVDVKVMAVQTKDELYEDWRKFIIRKKLNFINVYDPVHLNNTKERFDITSTPVIYLLDKDKKIKAKKLTADQVVEIIRNLETIQKL